MEFAAILEYKNLVHQVLSRVVCGDHNLDRPGAVRLGRVKNFASPLCICAMATAQPGLAFIKADIGERRGEADREPLCLFPRGRTEGIEECIHFRDAPSCRLERCQGNTRQGGIHRIIKLQRAICWAPTEFGSLWTVTCCTSTQELAYIKFIVVDKPSTVLYPTCR